MKKFLTRIILFLVLFTVLTGGVNQFFHRKNYISAFVDKLKMLEAKKNERKIIILGGSNAGFGLSAQLIQQHTGIPAINLGHYAGIGFIDWQPILLRNLTPNDIILFSPEWFFYSKPDLIDPPGLNNLISNNVEYGWMLNSPLYIFRGYMPNLRLDDLLEPVDKLPHVYQCFNEHGDIISHCGQPRLPLKVLNINHENLDIRRFEACFQFLKTNKTYFLFPPTIDSLFNLNKDYLKSIEKALIQQHYNVVNTPEENAYPVTDFYDTMYHLVCTKRDERTLQIIEILKKNHAFENNPQVDVK